LNNPKRKEGLVVPVLIDDDKNVTFEKVVWKLLFPGRVLGGLFEWWMGLPTAILH
jgi:hypothetical protein